MFCEVHYNMRPTPPQNKQGRNEGFNSRVRQIVNSIKVQCTSLSARLGSRYTG